MAKKIVSVLCVVVVLVASFSVTAFASGTLYAYDFDSDRGFTTFKSGHFKCITDLPYGKDSKIIEVRSVRSISGSSSSTLYCFSSAPSLYTYAVLNYDSNNTSTIPSGFYDLQSNPDWWDYIGTAFTRSSGSGSIYVDIYSSTPILRYNGSQWDVVGVQSNKIVRRTSGSSSGALYGLDDIELMYSFSDIVTGGFSVMNFTPFNVTNCTYEMTYSSNINAYSYIPTADELVYNYTDLLTTISDEVVKIRKATTQIQAYLTSIYSEFSVYLQNIQRNTNTIHNDIVALDRWLQSNMYVLLSQWEEMQEQNYAEILDRLDRIINTEGGIDPDMSKDREFGNDYFGGGDVGDVDPSSTFDSFRNGVLAFTHIFNLLDNSFAGLIGFAVSLVLMLALIGYILGRKVNK